jgi:DNA polymerase III alpha subunit (gram-positive type)
MFPARSAAEDCTVMTASTNLSCPECRGGDLITIGMQAGGNDLSFTTCHMCEAKWWYKDGQLVPLASVIGVVSTKA